MVLTKAGRRNVNYPRKGVPCTLARKQQVQREDTAVFTTGTWHQCDSFLPPGVHQERHLPQKSGFPFLTPAVRKEEFTRSSSWRIHPVAVSTHVSQSRTLPCRSTSSESRWTSHGATTEELQVRSCFLHILGNVHDLFTDPSRKLFDNVLRDVRDTIPEKMITDVNIKLIPKQYIRIKLRILRIKINSKTINPHENYRRYRYYRFSYSVGSWSRCTYPSIHFSLDEDTLKITVGCLVCVVCCGGVL